MIKQTIAALLFISQAHALGDSGEFIQKNLKKNLAKAPKEDDERSDMEKLKGEFSTLGKQLKQLVSSDKEEQPEEKPAEKKD